jgi:hypothetical protein
MAEGNARIDPPVNAPSSSLPGSQINIIVNTTNIGADDNIFVRLIDIDTGQLLGEQRSFTISGQTFSPSFNVTMPPDRDFNIRVEAGHEIIFFDNFDDGDYTNNPSWIVVSGIWDASNFYITTQSSNAIIYSSVSLPDNFELSFDGMTTGASTSIALSTSSSNLSSGSYRIDINSGTNIRFVRLPGTITIIDTGITGIDNVMYNIRLSRDSSGLWELFIDGISRGTGIDTTFSPSSLLYIILATGDTPHQPRWDNIKIIDTTP